MNKNAEAILFCFLKDGKILLEDRGQGFENETFFPSGRVEEKDKLKKGNYLENALLREVKEEFNNKIFIKEKEYKGLVSVPEINLDFHLYLITNWEGTFPQVIKEPNEPDSKIAFFPIHIARKMFKYESALKMLDLILKNN